MPPVGLCLKPHAPPRVPAPHPLLPQRSSGPQCSQDWVSMSGYAADAAARAEAARKAARSCPSPPGAGSGIGRSLSWSVQYCGRWESMIGSVGWTCGAGSHQQRASDQPPRPPPAIPVEALRPPAGRGGVAGSCLGSSFAPRGLSSVASGSGLPGCPWGTGPPRDTRVTPQRAQLTHHSHHTQHPPTTAGQPPPPWVSVLARGRLPRGSAALGSPFLWTARQAPFHWGHS